MNSASSNDRRWLTEAIDLSRLSPRTQTNYAVGAVIVDHDGTVLATGHTGERHSRDHAEEVALDKVAEGAGPELTRATIYSTLEPCTARRSRSKTCTELILTAGIERVVIALREPLLFADCRGVETLRDGGVEVVEISDMGHAVRKINSHVLDLRDAGGIR